MALNLALTNFYPPQNRPGWIGGVAFDSVGIASKLFDKNGKIYNISEQSNNLYLHDSIDNSMTNVKDLGLKTSEDVYMPNGTLMFTDNNPQIQNSNINYRTPTQQEMLEEQTRAFNEEGQSPQEMIDQQNWGVAGPTQQEMLDAQMEGFENVTSEELRVKIKSLITSDEIVFKVTPTIDEKSQAEYSSLSLIHHPGQVQIYKTTSSRSFSVSGKLISRNREEATENLTKLNLIRSWVMPYYGIGTAEDSSTANKLGAPPDTLKLFAYGKRHLDGIPVVLISYSWNYPDDVDYIPTISNEPFPVIMTVSLELTESYSPKEFSNFDLIQYKLGNLQEAFDFSREIKQSTIDEVIY